YGRWGFARERWFWIPDRRYSAAWVSWGEAPGYVTWCPLGFDNRPVFSFAATTVSPWSGWVVVPREQFGGRLLVRQYAVPVRSIPRQTAFSIHPPPPVPPRVGNPRSFRTNAGTRGPGLQADRVPRSAAPDRGARFDNRSVTPRSGQGSS